MELKTCEYLWMIYAWWNKKLHLSQNSIFFLSGALGNENSPQPLTVNVVRKKV